MTVGSKKVTVYITEDGAEFKKLENAENYDKRLQIERQKEEIAKHLRKIFGFPAKFTPTDKEEWYEVEERHVRELSENDTGDISGILDGVEGMDELTNLAISISQVLGGRLLEAANFAEDHILMTT